VFEDMLDDWLHADEVELTDVVEEYAVLWLLLI
jgi:hypothetical protein